LPNAEPFDPQKIGKYSVVQVYFEFPEEDPDFKIWVVLKHYGDGNRKACKCVKATSQFHWYGDDPDRLKGVVIYEANHIFSKKTAIEPHTHRNIAHEHFDRYARKKQYQRLGVMPPDFHQRFIDAVANSEQLKPKEIRELLEAVAATANPN